MQAVRRHKHIHESVAHVQGQWHDMSNESVITTSKEAVNSCPPAEHTNHI